MENEIKKSNARGITSVKSLLDFVMGFLYVAAAFFLFFADTFGFTIDYFDKSFRYIFGALCAVYGIWRIYRGFNKESV